MDSDLLTPRDIQARLIMSRSTVHRMLTSGELPAFAIRIGKRGTTYRVQKQALEKFLESRSTARVIPPIQQFLLPK